MKTRGRDSVESKMTRSNQKKLPVAPKELTREQVPIWNDMVKTRPDWWDHDTIPIMVAYVKAIDNYRRSSKLLESAQKKKITEVKDLMFIDKLTQIQERQARLLTVLATKLRLTPAALYKRNSGKPIRPGRVNAASSDDDRPWEDK